VRARTLDAMEFVLGHGTENDFVLLPDADGALDLDGPDGAELVRRLCHRRRGLGADGVLRAVRTDTPAAADAGVDGAGAGWFMDYRNADGSIAEMCGNGIRLFARYLVGAGLAAPGTFGVATRAGVREVTLGVEGDVTVDMGPARVGAVSVANVDGRDLTGIAVDVGNPHLACVVEDDAELEALDLALAPAYDAALFPHGVNVEVLRPLRAGATRLRVHERGSGETRSCGTGTVAGAVAALRAAGLDAGRVTVGTPGGTLLVTVGAGAGSTTTLSGPAVLVAHGQVSPALVPAGMGAVPTR